MKIASDITQLIGNTPIVQLKNVDNNSANIFLKLEYFNPGGSVKDRIALQMIEDAEREGKLKPGDTIIEATSGNTGIGAAMVAAAKGYKTVFVMPETMSQERRNLLKAYGANLILTPGEKGMNGSIEKLEELVKQFGYFSLRQFSNPSNPKAHIRTAMEIIEQMDNQIDGFVSGIGTGGTITGVGTNLKKNSSKIYLLGVEPADSPVLSGGKPGPHKIQGIGAGFIPEILDTSIYDEIFQVTTEQAFETARLTAKEEGILGGISTGAAIYAAKYLANKLGKGKNVVAIAPDNGERYLSTTLYSVES